MEREKESEEEKERGGKESERERWLQEAFGGLGKAATPLWRLLEGRKRGSALLRSNRGFSSYFIFFLILFDEVSNIIADVIVFFFFLIFN